MYGVVLRDMIEDEIAGREYVCSASDRILLGEMFDEVYDITGIRYRYITELGHTTIPDAGDVFLKYVTRFSSETIKAYILWQLRREKMENLAVLSLQLYKGFRASNEYIPPAGKPSPAHIHTRYDNIFRSLKPKRLKNELFDLLCSPRDAYYLSLTARVVASWKMPQMKQLLLSYLDGSCVTHESIGIPAVGDFYPSLSTIKRYLVFIAVDGLRYYPSAETVMAIEPFLSSDDRDVKEAAEKTMAVLRKKLG